MSESQDWFKSWFNTSYYHKLYKHRNDEEAQQFIERLIGFLELPKKSVILDLGCGKGRHSITLNRLGYRTIGVDLSESNIEAAKKHENDSLEFYVHDMRRTFRTNYFDAVLNLFTSFGYFQNNRDDYAVLESANKNLKPNGILVIDFFNSIKVQRSIKPEEKIESEGICFQIRKFVENGFIKKVINFNDQGTNFEFCEKVKLISPLDFELLLERANFKILNLLGNYQLEPFEPETSDRLIIIAQKKNNL